MGVIISHWYICILIFIYMKKSNISSKIPQLASGNSSSHVSRLYVLGKTRETIYSAVGSLWNVTTWSLIILRNVRTPWTKLVLTVQGLISSKPGFLGCLISSAWSLKIFFRNSFSDLIAGKGTVCNRPVWGRGSASPWAQWGCRWGVGDLEMPGDSCCLGRLMTAHNESWRFTSQDCFPLPPSVSHDKILYRLTNLIKYKTQIC